MYLRNYYISLSMDPDTIQTIYNLSAVSGVVAALFGLRQLEGNWRKKRVKKVLKGLDAEVVKLNDYERVRVFNLLNVLAEKKGTELIEASNVLYSQTGPFERKVIDEFYKKREEVVQACYGNFDVFSNDYDAKMTLKFLVDRYEQREQQITPKLIHEV